MDARGEQAAALGGVIAALATAIAVILPAGALGGAGEGSASTATGDMLGGLFDQNAIVMGDADESGGSPLAVTSGSITATISYTSATTHCEEDEDALTVYAECISTITGLVVNVDDNGDDFNVLTATSLSVTARVQAVAPATPVSSASASVTDLCIINEACFTGIASNVFSTSEDGFDIDIAFRVVALAAGQVVVTGLQVDVDNGVSVIDMALANAAAELTSIVDNTDPVVTLLTGPGTVADPAGRTADTTPTFTFSLTDDIGVVLWTCEEDGGGTEACDSNTSHTFDPALSDGSRSFEVCAEDAEGNSACADVNFEVDTTGPSVTIDNGPASGPPPWNDDNDPEFEFSSTDTFIESFECRMDGGAWVACTSPETFNNLSEGEHTFEVRGIDDLGNVGDAESLTFGVDTRSPQTTITAGPGFAANDDTPSWAFAGNDFGGAGIDHFHCWFGSGPVPANILSLSENGDTFDPPNDGDGCEETGSGDTGRFDPPLAPLSDGQYYFCVQAADDSGLGHSHDPTPACTSVIIDTTPPSASIKYQRKQGDNWVPYTPGNWSKTIVRAIVTCSDGGSGVADVNKKQTVYFNQSIDETIDPEDIFAPCEDRAGNENDLSGLSDADIMVDLGNPTCQATPHVIHTTENGALQWFGTSLVLDDDLDSVPVISFPASIVSSDGGGAVAGQALAQNGETGAFSMEVERSVANNKSFRRYTATLTITDDSGRSSTCTFSVRVT